MRLKPGEPPRDAHACAACGRPIYWGMWGGVEKWLHRGVRDRPVPWVHQAQLAEAAARGK